MIYRKWTVNDLPQKKVEHLSAELGMSSLVAKALVAKNVDTAEYAQTKYLEETPLSDPYLMKDMDKAVKRIWQAIHNNEKIVVYGDYDVDGVCATATLFTYLESSGANVFYKLPNRESEGYGLNKDVLAKLKEKGVNLVITVDNGIAAIDEIDFANEIGLDVVVTDHHLPKEVLPNALAVVDPLREDDTSPCKILAGVGVAFKLVCAMENAPCDDMLDYYADLVATGTIADLMLLEGENRTLVKKGIELINDTPRCGYEALLSVSSMLGKRISSENIAFSIAPRINAAGRMGDATNALELLLSEDSEEAMGLAKFLESENIKRKDTQNRIADEISAEIRAHSEMVKDRVIVVWGDDFHPGVIGIVASKLVEKYSKPSIVFTKDGDEYKGSGRSISGFSLHDALENTKEYLIRFGGHELAAGMAVSKENLENFRRAINDYAKDNDSTPQTPVLNADCHITLEEVTLQTVTEVDFLAPFGNGNPSPLFMAENMQIVGIIPVSGGVHTRVKMRQGNYVQRGVLFNTSPAEFAYQPGDYIDACFTLSIFENSNSNLMISMRIKEVRPSGMTDKMIDDYDVYRLFINDYPLTRQNKALIRPTRSEVATVYRKILSQKVHCEDLRPLFVSLPMMSSGKIQVIIDVLQDLGLIEIIRTDYINYYAPVAVRNKKDLMSSKILLALQ